MFTSEILNLDEQKQIIQHIHVSDIGLTQQLMANLQVFI